MYGQRQTYAAAHGQAESCSNGEMQNKERTRGLLAFIAWVELLRLYLSRVGVELESNPRVLIF
jgi:hypothetical protein